MSDDKTEKPTAKKREKAGEQGDRLMSREVIAAAAMLGGTYTLGSVATSWAMGWQKSYHACIALAFTGLQLSPHSIFCESRSILVEAIRPIVSVGVAAVGGAICFGLIQGGGQMRVTAIAPKWEKLNPINNAKVVFGQQAAVRLIRSSLPVLGVAWLGYREICKVHLLPALSLDVLPAMVASVYTLLFDAAVLMMGWSLVDFISTWKIRERRLKMTKQDVRDESKDAEGSPQIKGRIRSIQRQLRSRQLRKDVNNATVVITNPTEYAVALNFDFEQMEAPRLLAKGRDLIAAAIRDEARWAGIPIVESPPLARSLYRLVEPGQSIPFEFYAAVAGILAFLYRDVVEARARVVKPPEPTESQSRSVANTSNQRV